MRTKHKALIVAVSTALLTSVSLHAQDRGTTDGPQGTTTLEGELCSGTSGATCSPAIPDNGQTDSRFDVVGCDGVITDANIGVQANHTFVGNLIFTVRSPELTEVTIIDRPGLPADPPNGCYRDGILAMLDDEAGLAVEGICTSATPSIYGTFMPNNALTAFDGELGDGTWLLTVSDAQAGNTGGLVDWSVELTCEPAEVVDARTTFEVNKDFTDGNPAEVDVTLNCFTGLPLTQTQTISENQNVVFVVTDFDDGELDCEVTEEPVNGYSGEYYNGTESSSDGCEFDDVAFGQENVCTITNSPDPVEVEVNKDWIIEGSGGDELDGGYKLKLYCDGKIIDGYDLPNGDYSKTLYSSYHSNLNDASYYADVVPYWDGGTHCWVEEDVYDSGVEVYNGCTNLIVELGQDESCTVTNTVFYEGIPTLSNYGLALLALMMMGVGFVGFRRFA